MSGELKPVSGVALAGMGRKHFGNPIPQAWYLAARELLSHLGVEGPAKVPSEAGGLDAVTDEEVDVHLEAVLRASGSSLRHFTMHKTLAEMRGAMRTAMLSGAVKRG